jgi:tripartite-type tricarboxylate transporter receptor subunit TctC
MQPGGRQRLRRQSVALACALTALGASGFAQAQGFPSRPIMLVVPFTPGTGADQIARMLAPHMAEDLGTAVVVENKPGATGIIGSEFVAKAPPDGHTLLFTATSHATVPALKSKLPYDPLASFAPVSLAATSELAIVVSPQLPAATMREFIELAKKRPGALYYSSPGNGGVQNLSMELLKLETGIDLVHVPYKGAAGAVSDLLGGHVQATVGALQTLASHVQSGRLRMLAVLGEQRSAAFPDVPTLKELGLSNLVVETWYGVFAPAGTPAPVIARLNDEISAQLQRAELREAFARQGLNAVGEGPEQLGARVKGELARWARVVSAAHIKID